MNTHTDTKIKVALTINIRPGQATPLQKAAWGKFWKKLLHEVQDDR
jgi:hypothetical protein